MRHGRKVTRHPMPVDAVPTVPCSAAYGVHGTVSPGGDRTGWHGDAAGTLTTRRHEEERYAQYPLS